MRQTQALAVVTLGDDKSAQKLDNVQSKTDNEMKRFYLQYFFPPSSVGETGRVGAPGRRSWATASSPRGPCSPSSPSRTTSRTP